MAFSTAPAVEPYATDGPSPSMSVPAAAGEDSNISSDGPNQSSNPTLEQRSSTSSNGTGTAATPRVSPASHAVARKQHQRQLVRDKDPIVLTERAAQRVKELLAGDSAKGAVGIRLGVRRRGCNGLSYTLNYAFPTGEESENGGYTTNAPKKKRASKFSKDVEVEAHGVKVFIEPMALFSVVGTTMDWEESELASEFTFKNPNSKGECGCGESFTV
jgi:iron-sulfur cluster assembly 1